MSADHGLAVIPVRLTPDQARIIDAHAQLAKALASIEIPKSGRWENRETAIAVLEVLDEYLSATLDEGQKSDDALIAYHSDQRSVLPDIIRHFQQGKWGGEDPRLSADKTGAVGAAHDEALVKFKLEAVALVNGVSQKLKAEGVKDHKAEARKKVVREYQSLGLKFQTSPSSQPTDIEATMLESWEKRHKRRNRSRSGC